MTFAEATLGAEIKVPSHGGMPVSLRIPAGTPNGRTFRVRGKGVRRKDGTAGDMLVTVNVAGAEGPERQGAGRARDVPRRNRGPRSARRAAEGREWLATPGARKEMT